MSDAGAPRISGAATSEARPRRPAEAPEQEREDLAQLRARDVHRHRQQRRQDRADRVAREQQAGQPARRRPSHRAGTRRRPQTSAPAKASPWSEAELEDRRAGPAAGRRSPRRARRRTRSRARTGRPAGCAAAPGRSRRRRPARHPTTIAVRTRGSRSSQTIVSVAGDQVDADVEPERPRQDDAEGLGRADLDRAEADARATSETTSSDDAPTSADGDRPAADPGGDAAGVAGRGTSAPAAMRVGYGAAGSVTSGRMAAGQVAQADRQPRPGPGDLDVLDRPDVAVLDRGHDVPAGSRRDLLGRRHVERVDAQDDDLRIALDERLERRSRRCRVAGRDRVAAGERHHLGHERVVGRGEDLAGRVVVADLVEDARLGAALDGRGR